MAGKPSKAFFDAMRLIVTGETAYKAARRTGLNLSTIYRSPIYKAFRDNQPNSHIDQIREELRLVKISRLKR